MKEIANIIKRERFAIINVEESDKTTLRSNSILIGFVKEFQVSIKGIIVTVIKVSLLPIEVAAWNEPVHIS